MKSFSIVFLLVTAFVFNTEAQKRIAIVGGGIAGVSAAHFILKTDPTAHITLFEKETVLGGNAQTVSVLNGKGELCHVDVGPQYFTPGPWNDYISFLDETIGSENVREELLNASLVIQKEDVQNPFLATPLNGDFRGEKLGTLLRFRKFNIAANKVFKDPQKWKSKSMEEWVHTLDFEQSYKDEVIYPFLAASLGTNVADIKTTSAYEVVSLFAFRKPKKSTPFTIMQDGMGTLIQQIGDKLSNKGVVLKTNTPVISVNTNTQNWDVVYQKENLLVKETFDFVVMAVHADVAASILENNTELKEIQGLLRQLPYFEAHIVIHRDTNFIHTQKPAFLNIFTSKENDVAFSTMNLSLISNRLNGIYKSWLMPTDVLKVKANGTFIHETTFYHPLITVQFVKILSQLKESAFLYKNIAIIGGWTEGLETQNSAVVSAKRAADAYKNFAK